MKKLKSISIKQALFASLSCSIAITANAQNLPKIQQSNLRAPTNIKIDGKTTEWDDKFQAYQPVSRVFYTVSNDDNNLYLTIRTKDKFGSQKATNGITFTIEPGGKKAGEIAVTYPILSNTEETENVLDMIRRVGKYSEDAKAINKNKPDSLTPLANKHIDNLFNEIELSGIKEITDPSISVYNTYKIKVRGQLDSKMLYVYELAIPLKYLGASINTDEQFRYNIKLKGEPEKAKNGHGTVQFPNPVAVLSPDVIYMDYATDFWGEYTLAKK